MKDNQDNKTTTNNQSNENTGTFFPVRIISVDEHSDGQRIDNFLRRILPGLPKSKLYKILRKGEVRINKKRAKPEDKIKLGDEVRIPPITLDDKPDVFIPQNLVNSINELIIYQDKNYLVINKSANMAVHSGTKNNFGVNDLVKKAFPDKTWNLCHRLDKETSGCLLFASNREAQNAFNEQLKQGNVYKSYLTLVKGSWQANELLIDEPIEKQTINGFEKVQSAKKSKDGNNSNNAISIFTTQEIYSDTTLLKVLIKTGKTHQIRVHAANQKHPVAMDDKYGDFKWNKTLEKRGLNRLFLHAHILRFRAFDNEIYICAPLASELQIFLDSQNQVSFEINPQI